MEENIEQALIAFINSKPDGNELRDIAIRTLKDINSRKEVTYIDQPTLRPIPITTPLVVYWIRKRVKRILPSIPYKSIKRCGHNWKTKCVNI